MKESRRYGSDGEMYSRTLTEWVTTAGEGTNASSHAKRDPRAIRTVTLTIENGLALATMSEAEYETPGVGGNTAPADPSYFALNNATRQKSYHYLSVSESSGKTGTQLQFFKDLFAQSGQVASASETVYHYDANYKARGIASLPVETRQLNPANLSGPELSKSQIIYDNAMPGASGAYNYAVHSYGTGNSLDCSTDPQNPKLCWQNPNGSNGSIDLTKRGLPTTARVWHAETNSWIETNTQYDQFGNVVKTKDPVGNEVTTEFASLHKYAYPTKVISPPPDPTNTGHGTNQTSTAETTYDFTTGLPLTTKDDFGQITEMEYDAMLRPYRVKPVVVSGVATGPITETLYGTPNQTTGQFPSTERFVTVRKQIGGSNWDEATTWFDGLGRTVKTQAKDSQGDVFVDTFYDAYGRFERVTNPYRQTDTTIYWSKTRYDAAGRAVESFAPAKIGDINQNDLTSLGVTSFDISSVTDFVGTVVMTTDAAGRKSRSITNAIGQLLRVDEPTATGGTETQDLGDLATPHQPTIY